VVAENGNRIFLFLFYFRLVESRPTPRPSLVAVVHGVFLGPLPGGLVVFIAVGFVDAGDLGHEGVVGVGVREHRADAEQDFADCEGGRPLGFEDVQADGARAVYIGVVHLGGELQLWGFKGVVGGEVYRQTEDAP